MKTLFSSEIMISTKQKVTIKKKQKNMRRPGVEPGTAAWKATMLTVTPPTPDTSPFFIKILNF